MSNSDFERIGEQIAVLRSHFIVHERFTKLEQQFQLLFYKRRADLKLGKISEARGIAVIGASGTGKTTAVDRLIAKSSLGDASDLNASSGDIISLRIPSPATLKYVGQTILRALGYDLKADRQAWYIWDLVRHQLKERRVLFLHLDEAQDLYAKGTQREMQSVVNMLKSLMQDNEWPVGIVLSGTNELRDILNFDPQLGRRFFPVQFERIGEHYDVGNVLELVNAYVAKTALKPSPGIQSEKFGLRLIHAAAHEFGLVIEITIAAIEEALIANSPVLGIEEFAKAFRRRSACMDGVNPFLAPDFTHIDARQLLGKPEDLG